MGVRSLDMDLSEQEHPELMTNLGERMEPLTAEDGYRPDAIRKFHEWLQKGEEEIKSRLRGLKEVEIPKAEAFEELSEEERRSQPHEKIPLRWEMIRLVERDLEAALKKVGRLMESMDKEIQKGIEES